MRGRGAPATSASEVELSIHTAARVGRHVDMASTAARGTRTHARSRRDAPPSSRLWARATTPGRDRAGYPPRGAQLGA